MRSKIIPPHLLSVRSAHGFNFLHQNCSCTIFENTKLLSVPLQTPDGQTLTFPNDVAKPLVVIGWSTWCVPCKVEMQRIELSIKAGNINPKHVLAINLGETPAEVKAYVNNAGLSFPVAIDSTGAFSQQMKLSITPTVYLVDENSEVIWASSGVGVTEIWRIESHLKKTLNTN